MIKKYEYVVENKQTWSCGTCIHNSVCKHKEAMEEEVRKLKEVVQKPPVRVTLSCDRYQKEEVVPRPGEARPYFGSN